MKFLSFVCDKMIKYCYSLQIQTLNQTHLHKIVLPDSRLALSNKNTSFPLIGKLLLYKKVPWLDSQESLNYLHWTAHESSHPLRQHLFPFLSARCFWLDRLICFEVWFMITGKENIQILHLICYIDARYTSVLCCL